MTWQHAQKIVIIYVHWQYGVDTFSIQVLVNTITGCLQFWKYQGSYYFWNTHVNLREFEMHSGNFFNIRCLFSWCNLKHRTSQDGNLTCFPPLKKSQGRSKIWKKDAKMAAKVILYIGFTTLQFSGKSYSDGLENPENSGNFILPNLWAPGISNMPRLTTGFVLRNL